jgi:hypothetical protein
VNRAALKKRLDCSEIKQILVSRLVRFVDLDRVGRLIVAAPDVRVDLYEERIYATIDGSGHDLVDIPGSKPLTVTGKPIEPLDRRFL